MAHKKLDVCWVCGNMIDISPAYVILYEWSYDYVHFKTNIFLLICMVNQAVNLKLHRQVSSFIQKLCLTKKA